MQWLPGSPGSVGESPTASTASHTDSVQGRPEPAENLLGADPAAPLHEVLLHTPGERDRPAEPHGTESNEIAEQGWKARALRVGLLCAYGPLAVRHAIDIPHRRTLPPWVSAGAGRATGLSARA